MSLSRQHDMHKRRFSRNLGLGLALAGMVAIVFGLTVVKVQTEEWTQPLFEQGDAQ